MAYLAASGGAREQRILFQPIVDIRTNVVLAHQAVVFSSAPGGRADTAALPGARSPVPAPARLSGVDCTVLVVRMPVSGRLGETLVDQLATAALAAGIAPDRVVAQLCADERGRVETQLRIAEACADRGIGLAIGSFTAGPLGMRLLSRIDAQFVSFDPTVVRNIAASAPRQQVVRGVVRLMRRMTIPLIAPEVDSASDLAMLRALGLRYFQGTQVATAVADAGIFGPALSPARHMPRGALTAVADRAASAMHRRLAHQPHQLPADSMRGWHATAYAL